jgi:sugar lactone lactonase YvrE
LADQNFRVKRGLEVGIGATVLTALPGGSVGIGTTNPTEEIHLWTSQNEGTVIRVDNPNTGTVANASVRLFSDTATVTHLAHGSGRVASRFGTVLARFGEISLSSGNGLLVGTQNASPLIFGTNDTETLRIDSSQRVGIGTTNPTSKLTVIGDGLIVGVLTATSFSGNASSATYATTAGIATYATTAGVSTSVIGGIGSITQLQVTGVSTFTNGPVLIGSGTSTGTASQRLQVTGGAYVSGSVGIGTTNPSAKLQVQGNTNINNTLPFTVSYGSSFSVGSQESAPQEIAFSNDGRTMYILGSSGDDITWYTLSTPWNITTASHVGQFSVSAQTTSPIVLTFKPDGTKFYITGTAGTVGAGATSVSEYFCRTPWNLTTAGYTTSYSVISQITNPADIEFNTDGTQFYVLDFISDFIQQYSCSTPWSIASGVSVGSSFSITSQESAPQGFAFSNDGTKLLLTGTTGDDINYYTLSTPWDITTTSFVGIITAVGPGTLGETAPSGLYWRPDGTKLYLTGTTLDTIFQFNITSNAQLEVTGKTYLYGDVEIHENLDVYGEQSNYGNAYFYNNVGIGTTNPTSKLEAVDLAANPSVAPVIFIQRPNNIIPGSIAPTNAELRIKGHSSNYKIYVEDHSSNSLLAVTGAGNVGVGLTNPFSKLQINYSSSTAYSATATPQTANAITLLNTNTTATTTFSGIALGNARNGNTAFVGIECVGTGNDTTALAFKTQSAGPVFAEVARFDSSGRLTLPYQPAFIATKSSGQTLTQSVNNVVSFDTEVIDIGSNYSSNKFTAPVSGTYQFQFTCMGSSPNAGYLRMSLKKNGSGFYGTTYATITISAYESIVTSSLINLSANDYVEAEIFPTMTSFALDNTGTFSGYLVG